MISIKDYYDLHPEGIYNKNNVLITNELSKYFSNVQSSCDVLNFLILNRYGNTEFINDSSTLLEHNVLIALLLSENYLTSIKDNLNIQIELFNSIKEIGSSGSTENNSFTYNSSSTVNSTNNSTDTNNSNTTNKVSSFDSSTMQENQIDESNTNGTSENVGTQNITNSSTNTEDKSKSDNYEKTITDYNGFEEKLASLYRTKSINLYDTIINVTTKDILVGYYNL